MLQHASKICGHNIIGYDIPVLKKLYPGFEPQGEVIDTLVISRVAFTDIKQGDYGRFHRGQLPGNLIGSYKLEAWGYRLGELKGDYGKKENAWEVWTPEMTKYCVQDVKVTAKLYERLKVRRLDPQCFGLEHKVAEIIAQQEINGFSFNVKKAEKLLADLVVRRTEIAQQLIPLFPPWYKPKGMVFTPKKDNKKLGYREGCPMTKLELVEFNPNSRTHVARVLQKHFGWVPTVFTENSKEPKIDDEILSLLPWPEAQLISEYMTVQKRLGQLAEGDKAWLKYLNKQTGRIHGGVNTNGAVTGRMTHMNPNMGQVPSVDSPYGDRCRELFEVPPGYKLVGTDASGLEARCLGHFLARYDDGEYISIVINGKKEDGTDVHGRNMKALGLPKPQAKRWFYAWCYGAGDDLLGAIAGGDAKLGKKLRTKFLKAMPAIAKLIGDIQERAKKEGKIRGLDGRVVTCRSPHSALNTLLQGAGAIIMKEALVICEERLREAGIDFKFVANVHDEFQNEVREDQAELAAEIARQAIIDAGVALNFRCPLDAESKIGNNWAETH